MMDAARISETSLHIQLRTRQYIPEDSELHLKRHLREKSDMKLGLQNYAVIIPIETSCVKFNNNKINSLHRYDIAQIHKIRHKVVHRPGVGGTVHL
jgi:glycine cleavage system protein P-like pyridoxal-binding family